MARDDLTPSQLSSIEEIALLRKQLDDALVEIRRLKPADTLLQQEIKNNKWLEAAEYGWRNKAAEVERRLQEAVNWVEKLAEADWEVLEERQEGARTWLAAPWRQQPPGAKGAGE